MTEASGRLPEPPAYSHTPRTPPLSHPNYPGRNPPPRASSMAAAENPLEGSENRARADVAAAVRGDQEAVRALWQENRRWVAAVILAHKPREADLEDLLQDVAMSFVK